MHLRPHHTNISVADLDATEAWYQHTLGFETEKRFTNIHGAQVALLSAPGGARVELTQPAFNSEGIAWKDSNESLATRGMTHIAFEVDDLEESFNEAVAGGAKPVMEPRNGSAGNRMAFIHDNEGNLLELYVP